LTQGVSILDTVHEAGYFDQAHLTRSLRHFIGQTPARIIRATRSCRFYTKQRPFPDPMMAKLNRWAEPS
jgi:hypothetical protein